MKSCGHLVLPALCSYVVLSGTFCADAVGKDKPSTKRTDPSKEVKLEDDTSVEIQAVSGNKIDEASKYIHCLRQYLEEWGTVTMSSPVVMKVKGQFDFGNDAASFLTPKEYVQYEQTHTVGGSAVLNEAGVSSQTNAQVSPAPAATATTATTTPAATATQTPAPVAVINNALSSATPALSNGLFQGTFGANVANPGRTAVLQGINDKMTERILTTMANPPYDKFVNPSYEIYFAIVQVSCNPGWRTRVNYVSDLSATCEYYDSTKQAVARNLPDKQPLVFSVLPLIDAQSLELSNSDHQLTSLAAQINASYPAYGLSILGQELISFVHRNQRDVLTRTPVTVTNSYANKHTFGFRMAPSLTALRDPAARHSGTANVLQSTSFPVLVTVIVQRSSPNNVYDSIVTHVTHRWIINERPPLPQWYRRLALPLRREKFAQRRETTASLIKLRNLLTDTNQPESYPQNSVPSDFALLRNELLDLEAKCGDQDQYFQVYTASKKPSISSVDGALPQTTGGPANAPHYATVPASGAFSLVIHGSNLGTVTKVLAGARSATEPLVSEDGTEIVATFTDTAALPAEQTVPLVAVDRTGAFATAFIQVAKAAKEDKPPVKKDDKPAAEADDKKAVSIRVDRSADQGGPISIDIGKTKASQASDADLLSSLVKMLGVEKRPEVNRNPTNQSEVPGLPSKPNLPNTPSDLPEPDSQPSPLATPVLITPRSTVPLSVKRPEH